MKLVRFSQDDNEVLIDPEKILYVRKTDKPFRKKDPIPTVYVHFGGTDGWVGFNGRDAENVWNHFVNYFN